MRKNDIAWKRFFDRTDYLSTVQSKGFCFVTADELKNHGQREPRLMAKLDTLSVRPGIFKEHQLSIFPVTNGKYVIFQDKSQKTYFDLSGCEPETVETYRSSVDLGGYDSYNTSGNLSEAQAIDFAFLSSLTHSFLADTYANLVIRGRAYSGKFCFYTPDTNKRIDVASVQIEIDAGYESPTGIYLLEAKVGRRTDFHIRQLYYPFLEWSGRSNKRIVPIFLTYTNGQYMFTELRFNEHFGDLEVARTRAFVIDEYPSLRVDLSEVLRRTPELAEGSPYPQANDLDKVVDLVRFASSGPCNKSTIADFFEFDERQGDYYANAACYLGLFNKVDGGFELTPEGEFFVRLRSRQERTKTLLATLSSYPTFRQVLSLWQARGFKTDKVSKREIASSIERYTKLSGTTPLRRASTVRSWMNWLEENCEFVTGAAAGP